MVTRVINCVPATPHTHYSTSLRCVWRQSLRGTWWRSLGSPFLWSAPRWLSPSTTQRTSRHTLMMKLLSTSSSGNLDRQRTQKKVCGVNILRGGDSQEHISPECSVWWLFLILKCQFSTSFISPKRWSLEWQCGYIHDESTTSADAGGGAKALGHEPY